MVSAGLKANSKKIRETFREPSRILSFIFPHLSLPLPVSPSGLPQQAPYAAKGPIPLVRKIKQKKPSRVLYVRFVKVISRFGAMVSVEVVCPTQHECNLKGRCLFIWPFSLSFQYSAI